MNWLDVILIIFNIVLLVLAIICVYGVISDAYGFMDGFGLTILALVIYGLVLLVTFVTPFVAIDKSEGITVGKITSVDKNFFGTTTIYIKTSETEQEPYCTEDDKIIEKAKELIDKKVKIGYGTRVGLYSTSKCHQAPVENIEEVE